MSPILNYRLNLLIMAATLQAWTHALAQWLLQGDVPIRNGGDAMKQ